MSLRFGSLGLFLSVVAIALAANQADIESARGTRAPASIAYSKMHKEEVLGPFQSAANELRHTEKLRGPLSVKIELVGDTPKAGDTFVLRGTIASRKALGSANFTWNVPPGIEVVNGSITGHLDNVTSDQPAIVELTLKKTADGNAQVHLMANSVLNEVRFGDSAQFNTDVQNMLSGTKGTLLGKSNGDGKAPAELKIFH